MTLSFINGNGRPSIRRLVILCVCLFPFTHSAYADAIRKFTLKPAANMHRADLYVWNPVAQPAGVLVLIPGTNGNGERMVRDLSWQEFARRHNLALMGVSFASDLARLEQGKGYYFASQGSGGLLLEGIQKAFSRDLPILLFGFSAGAHFTSRFVEWKPERVVTWCAYSAGSWDEPKAARITPPGIVGCGEEDVRLGASLVYFKEGRVLGRPWLWIAVPKTGHSCPPSVVNFVRDYFTCILKGGPKLNPKEHGLWVDIDRLEQIPEGSVHPAVTAWLPDRGLYERWKGIQTP